MQVGSGSYTIENDKPRGPCFSIKSRIPLPEHKAKTPGPGTYDIFKFASNGLPRWSFGYGSRYSSCVTKTCYAIVG